jgi:hypothetical protein
MTEETVRRRFVPKSYAQRYGGAVRVELAAERRMRTRNKMHYRWAHWPIWIWVFFIAPGPMTAALFAGEVNRWTVAWLLIVLAGTGIAFWRGKMPGVEPAPYILRFGDDMPNPLYRRICYTFGWSVIISFAAINFIGLADAVVTGHWRMREIYRVVYFPIAGAVWILGALGWLPRARHSTKQEGIDRRYFYGSVWAVTVSQPVLWLLWKTLPRTHQADIIKLVVYAAMLAGVGLLARFGFLPRTRPILPGTIGRAD